MTSTNNSELASSKTTTDNRRFAVSAIKLITELRNIISQIDRGDNITQFEDNIQNKTIKLGNIIKKMKIFEKSVVTLSYKELRCAYAHLDGTRIFKFEDYEFWKQKFIKIVSNIEPELQKIQNQSSQNAIKYEFEKSMTTHWGTEENRKSIVDALEDSFDNNILSEDKIEFPQNSGIIKDIAENFNPYLKYYVSNHEGLLENVQADILVWANDTANNDVELESLKYFVTEQLFLDKIRKFSPNDFFSDIADIEEKYNAIESVQEKFDMQKYQILCNSDIDNLNTIEKQEKVKKIEFYKQKYFDACLKALIENFNARKSTFEQKLIDEKRKKFLKELYEKIENFKKLEECLQPFIDDLGHGYLWDMSNAPFRNLGFDILKKYVSLLSQEEILQKFAELLGKQSITSQKIEKKIIEESVVTSEYHPKPAQNGNIIGFEYSNEISRVFLSETALLTDPDLENLFYLRLAEKKLLSYRYLQNETQQKEIEVSKSEDLTDPIIICVDTSGSMQGTPEQTAKIATFALAKIAIRQHRKCFLISFSTDIETLDMSDFKRSNALELLVNFLNKSFNGGTDATPALAECLRQLKTENYKNADVLMISDFVMGNLPENLVSQIKAEQEKDTFFYSLVIGQSENNKVIEYFNDNITYNPYDESSRQEFYKKIRQIAVKRKKS